jgi:hypothetical protein
MYILYMAFAALRSLRERLRLTPKQTRYQPALCPETVSPSKRLLCEQSVSKLGVPASLRNPAMYILYMAFAALRSLRERLRLTPKQTRWETCSRRFQPPASMQAYQPALCPEPWGSDDTRGGW